MSLCNTFVCYANVQMVGVVFWCRNEGQKIGDIDTEKMVKDEVRVRADLLLEEK